MLRVFDIVLSVLGLIVTSPILLLLAIIGYCETGLPLFRQVRVGRDQQPFTLLKFRTMWPDTAQAATHLLEASAVTPFGRFQRRTKLDELPQLWNVLKGDMSMVGPRPCLFSQKELIEARERLRVFGARPGITGLAQINGVDTSEPYLLAETDASMLAQLGIKTYFQFILMTAVGKGSGDRLVPEV